MSMAKCPKCASPIAQTANFCVTCGASFTPEDINEVDAYIGHTVADNYLIQDRIGVGSMGVVYVAEQLSLKKKVAIKILQKKMVHNAEVLARFEREARAASRLDHPNSISILDFGQNSDGAPFIAMEYLDGRDLAQILAEDFPIDPVRIINFMMMVCSALDEAHAEGIIHRDIKPANIMVCQRRSGEEYVKVLDFGIAKLNDPETGAPLTREGLVCGTPAFMSPEQVTGEPLDPRTDIYSLGVILFTLLTGRLPFQAASSAAMAAKILTEDPPKPSKVRLDIKVDSAFDALIERALARDREGRYATALDFRRALETTLGQLAPEASFTSAGYAVVSRSPEPAPQPAAPAPLPPAPSPFQAEPMMQTSIMAADQGPALPEPPEPDNSVPTVFDAPPVQEPAKKARRGIGAIIAAIFLLFFVLVGAVGVLSYLAMKDPGEVEAAEEQDDGDQVDPKAIERTVGLATYESRLAMVRAADSLGDKSAPVVEDSSSDKRDKRKARKAERDKSGKKKEREVVVNSDGKGPKPETKTTRAPSGKVVEKTPEAGGDDTPAALKPGALANEEYQKGQGLMNSNPGQALAHFEKAVKHNSRHRNAWLGIHRMSVRLGNDRRAKMGCLRVVALSREGDVHRKGCEKWLERN